MAGWKKFRQLAAIGGSNQTNGFTLKLTRIVAVGAVTALVAGSTLLLAGTASADDTYVHAADFVAETSPYPAGWFIGGGSTGTITDTAGGISLAGRIQILNGTTPAQGLGDLVDGAHIGVTSGNVTFQIPLFTDGTLNTGYTTLRPDNFGNDGLNPLAGWTTSGAIGTFAAGTSHTIPEYEAELNELPTDYRILAYGLFVPALETAVISSVTWNGNNTFFTPSATTGTVTPAAVTPAQFSTTGITATFTGFVPGDVVTAGIGSGQSGDSIDGEFTADASGVVTIHYVGPADTALGDQYSIGVFSENSRLSAFAQFSIVAAAAPTAALAATGQDLTLGVTAGILFLLGGAVFGAFALRRRHANKA